MASQTSWLARRNRLQSLAFAAIAAIALAVTLLANRRKSHGDAKLGARILQDLRQLQGRPYHLTDAASFAWESLHIFTPYTDTSSIDRQLGFHWADASHVDLRDSDNAVVLAFVHDRSVVRYVKIERGHADFAPAHGNAALRFTREAAVFRARNQDGWTYVEPVLTKAAVPP